MNVGRLGLENLEKYGEYEALFYEGRPYTNLEQAQYAAALATALDRHGVRAGDRVVVMMPNSPEVTAAFQAVWRLGAVIVPVTPQLQAAEVAYMLRDSGARAVVTCPVLADRLIEACSDLQPPPELFVLGPTPGEGASDLTAEIELARGVMPLDHLTEREDDDLALLLYTSGTTGKPKGVMLTHENMLSNARSVAAMNPDLEPFTRGLHVLPLSHSYGVLMMNLGLIFGLVSALLPHFEIRAVFELLERYRVQRFSVVPTMLTYMLSYPERSKFDLSALEKVGSGGAALPEEVRLEFEEVFGCEVKEGYGMSECAPSATGYRPEEPYRPGSVGRAIPGVEVTIRDDDDAEVEAGTQGEICIRGPNVMQGYWNLPEATSEALRGGWLHSGDVGYKDADGFVFITDRKKDLIIKGAENISPREIEEVIYRHPAVAEVAVIGLPHPTYGEDLCAVVAVRGGEAVEPEEIRAHVAGLVTKFKVPSRVELVDELPKSGNGKILKRELRERFADSA